MKHASILLTIFLFLPACKNSKSKEKLKGKFSIVAMSKKTCYLYKKDYSNMKGKAWKQPKGHLCETEYSLPDSDEHIITDISGSVVFNSDKIKAEVFLVGRIKKDKDAKIIKKFYKSAFPIRKIEKSTTFKSKGSTFIKMETGHYNKRTYYFEVIWNYPKVTLIRTTHNRKDSTYTISKVVLKKE